MKRPASCFPSRYLEAHQEFCETAGEIGWTLEFYSHDNQGAEGEDLVTAVACSNPADSATLESNSNSSRKTLILSTGLHGVEGFLGTAVLLRMLDHWRQSGSPACNVILIHALNPCGYSYLRRVDSENRDLNRNFLLPGQSYSEAPELYRRMDRVLNPKHSPRRLDPFVLHALLAVCRFGFSAVQAAIASGQYEYPQGIFYGGSQPAPISQWLKKKLPDWLVNVEHVLHLDFHTGLGKPATYKLMFETAVDEKQRRRLLEVFREEELLELRAGRGTPADDANTTSSGSRVQRRGYYGARGSFGSWCAHYSRVENYLFAFAEFGTYHPLHVLKALRAENQWEHYSAPGGHRSLRMGAELYLQPEKQRLLEAFCPRSEAWRQACLVQAQSAVQRATRSLLRDG